MGKYSELWALSIINPDNKYPEATYLDSFQVMVLTIFCLGEYLIF